MPAARSEFYKDAQGKWRWRRIAANGKLVGASSEGYVNKQDCIDSAKRNDETYRYAASRNSEVFHYSGCWYVTNILSTNLVCYQTRDEAVEDGKRPCQGKNRRGCPG